MDPVQKAVLSKGRYVRVQLVKFMDKGPVSMSSLYGLW
jgi:hypothetical protein